MYLIKYLSIYLMMVSLYTYNRFFFLDLPLSQQCLQISRIEGFLFMFVYFFCFVLFCFVCLFFNLIKTLAITKYLLTILTYKQCMLLTLLTKLYSTYKTILIDNVRYLRYEQYYTLLTIQNLQYLLTMRYLHC